MTNTDPRAARQDVADVLLRYASAIDQRDWDRFRTCFTPDCTADYGDVGLFEGVEALTEFMIASHADMGHTFHRITNIEVEVDGPGAVARSYVDAVLLDATGSSGVNPVGRYDDELVLGPDGWRISKRVVTIAIYRVIG